jgi:hypothetical protein
MRAMQLDSQHNSLISPVLQNQHSGLVRNTGLLGKIKTRANKYSAPHNEHTASVLAAIDRDGVAVDASETIYEALE